MLFVPVIVRVAFEYRSQEGNPLPWKVIRTVPVATASRSAGGSAKLNPLPESMTACGTETETAPGADPCADCTIDTSMLSLASAPSAAEFPPTAGERFATGELFATVAVIAALSELTRPLPAFVVADAPAVPVGPANNTKCAGKVKSMADGGGVGTEMFTGGGGTTGGSEASSIALPVTPVGATACVGRGGVGAAGVMFAKAEVLGSTSV